MHNKLCYCVAILGVSVAETDLRVAVLKQANSCHVKELDVLIEIHPEDPIQFVIHHDLVLHLLHPKGCH